MIWAALLLLESLHVFNKQITRMDIVAKAVMGDLGFPFPFL